MDIDDDGDEDYCGFNSGVARWIDCPNGEPDADDYCSGIDISIILEIWMKNRQQWLLPPFRRKRGCGFFV